MLQMLLLPHKYVWCSVVHHTPDSPHKTQLHDIFHSQYLYEVLRVYFPEEEREDNPCLRVFLWPGEDYSRSIDTMEILLY